MRRFWWTLPLLAAFFAQEQARGQTLDIDFDEGVAGWRTVLDGVMGGRSSGRISQAEPGVLRFTGSLSLENNGGFSQMQTSVPAGSLASAQGIELRVRGDGRTYQFDLRTSDVRLMAGAFSADFETRKGEWTTVRLPFSAFKLYNFGRLVRNPPALRPDLIESLGITLADKKTGDFQLEVDFVRGLGGAQPAERTGSLGDVANAAGLTTLLSLVEASGLMLPSDTRVTILAPTNAAFASIPADKVAFLTSQEGLPLLRTILKHHVIGQPLASADLLKRSSVDTLAGQRLAVDANSLRIGPGAIAAADVAFDGGIVHVVDAVLVPETRTIAAVVSGDERLSLLNTALATAGLASQLGEENDGPWTLLAPSNEAFAALGEEVLADLAANPSRLVEILAAHVIPSRIYRDEMLAQGSTRALGGGNTIAFGLASGKITADGASILAPDLPAANGVIHIIDRVLLPDAKSDMGSDAPAITGEARQRGLLLIETALELGVPLFNNGNEEACAGIYEITIVSLREFAAPALSTSVRETLSEALDRGRSDANAASRAWTYRRALDAAAMHLAR